MRMLPLLLCLALVAGCSGFQATTGAASYIDTTAAYAKLHQASTQPAVDLQGEASNFVNITGTSTTNLFSHWFAGKEVWTNATIWTPLQEKRALLVEMASRAKAGTLAPADQTLALQVAYQWANLMTLDESATPASQMLATRAHLRTKLMVHRVAASQPVSATSASELQNLVNSLPVAFQPWAVQYGPALLRLGLAEADAELALLVAGDTDTPYKAALTQFTEDELMTEAARVLVVDIAATNTNAANVAAEKQAAYAALSLGLTLILGVFGL
jgi:hypothetical protein